MKEFYDYIVAASKLDQVKETVLDMAASLLADKVSVERKLLELNEVRDLYRWFYLAAFAIGLFGGAWTTYLVMA